MHFIRHRSINKQTIGEIVFLHPPKNDYLIQEERKPFYTFSRAMYEFFTVNQTLPLCQKKTTQIFDNIRRLPINVKHDMSYSIEKLVTFDIEEVFRVDNHNYAIYYGKNDTVYENKVRKDPP